MPYRNKDELPESIKHVLPTGAQSIYIEAFNHAFEEYKSPSKRRAARSREETAHRVAWAAVKKTYEKKNGKWQKK
jgi:cation transport regulator